MLLSLYLQLLCLAPCHNRLSYTNKFFSRVPEPRGILYPHSNTNNIKLWGCQIRNQYCAQTTGQMIISCLRHSAVSISFLSAALSLMFIKHCSKPNMDTSSMSVYPINYLDYGGLSHKNIKDLVIASAKHLSLCQCAVHTHITTQSGGGQT